MSPCGKPCGKILHGAVGIAKSRLHIDRAPKNIIEDRRAICRACDYAEKRVVLGLIEVRMCERCTCLVRDKTNVASEFCPEKKWTEVQDGN